MRKREMGDEDENNMEDTRGPEKFRGTTCRLCLEDLLSVVLPAGSELIPAISGMVN